MPRDTEIAALAQYAETGFKLTAEALRRQSDMTMALARVTYKGLTGDGKARYVDELANMLGSDRDTAEYLALSEVYIKRLRKRAKRNGK